MDAPIFEISECWNRDSECWKPDLGPPDELGDDKVLILKLRPRSTTSKQKGHTIHSD